jgi:hypothetical protein
VIELAERAKAYDVLPVEFEVKHRASRPKPGQNGGLVHHFLDPLG